MSVLVRVGAVGASDVDGGGEGAMVTGVAVGSNRERFQWRSESRKVEEGWE